jgi:hypothetical protein
MNPRLPLCWSLIPTSVGVVFCCTCHVIIITRLHVCPPQLGLSFAFRSPVLICILDTAPVPVKRVLVRSYSSISLTRNSTAQSTLPCCVMHVDPPLSPHRLVRHTMMCRRDFPTPFALLVSTPSASLVTQVACNALAVKPAYPRGHQPAAASVLIVPSNINRHC